MVQCFSLTLGTHAQRGLQYLGLRVSWGAIFSVRGKGGGGGGGEKGERKERVEGQSEEGNLNAMKI